jgi:catechol-2,3-dioxygenase
MPIARLNHAVLFVRDAEVAARFYQDVLGFRMVGSMPNAVFLQAEGSNNDHDLGLFAIGQGAGPSMAGRQTVGLYHLAWEVETLDDLERFAERLTARRALVGASDHGTTKALYGRDPDGNEFEVCWLVPADRITEEMIAAKTTIGPLDIAAEKERYGGSLRGGVGISSKAPATTA